MTEQLVLITRESAEVGKPGRVYVTGPHFGYDTFSSTRLRTEATRFDRAEAERYLALGKWRMHSPRIEEER